MSRHDRELQGEDTARFRMRRGMARAALIIKRERALRDVHNQPLSYAQRMSAGHSERQLEAWTRNARKTIVAL